MRYFLLIAVLLAWNIATAQDYDLNLLQTPTNPAFIIMENAPAEIETPSSPTDFVFSIQNASQNFTEIPDNFALSLAPAWVFGGKNISFSSFREGNANVFNNIWQSLQISAGASDDGLGAQHDRRFGAGLKFSLFRGDIDPGVQANYFMKFRKYNTIRGKLRDEYLAAHPEHQRLDSMRDGALETLRRLGAIETRSDAQEQVFQQALAQVEELSEKMNNIADEIEIADDSLINLMDGLRDIKFARTGFFWDLGGGVAFDQYALSDSAEMHRLGVWTNIGYQFNDEQAIIGLGRFLQNNNEPFINTDEQLDTTSYNSLDVGVKYAYDITETFSLSGEVIYRTLLHNEMDLDNAYRFALNLDIEVAPNKILNFSYGRNFEGAVSREGDYFALLNFIVGLGGKRPVH